MTKEEARLSVMGAISMALKNSTLQQGFEIICKENAELEKENAELKEKLKEELKTIADKDLSFVARFDALEKENAELKYELKKWKDGIALKDEEIGCIETEFNTFKSKAKELIRDFLSVAIDYIDKEDKNYSYIVEAEQFIKDSEVEK